jgi:hypothetical protein
MLNLHMITSVHHWQMMRKYPKRLLVMTLWEYNVVVNKLKQLLKLPKMEEMVANKIKMEDNQVPPPPQLQIIRILTLK